MLIAVITGLSGVGKTRTVEEIRNKGVKAFVMDLDEYEPGIEQNDEWRSSAYRRFLAEATAKADTAVLFGQILLDEFSAAARELKIAARISFAIMTLDEPTRISRLQAKGWSINSIQQHAQWAAATDLLSKALVAGAIEFTVSNLNPKAVAEMIWSWVDSECSIGTKNQDGIRQSEVQLSVPLISTEPERQIDKFLSNIEYPLLAEMGATTISNAISVIWAEGLSNLTSLKEVSQFIQLNPAYNMAHLYHPLSFPELSKLRSVVDPIRYKQKENLIISEIYKIADSINKTPSDISIIDIGCNSGSLCLELASQGFKVTGYEADSGFYSLAKKLAELKDLKVCFKNVNFSACDFESRIFDVSVLLSVFQWIAEAGNRLEEAGKELYEFSRRCTYMIFELGYNKGYSCLTTEDPDEYAELLKLLLKYTVYTDFRLAGMSDLYPGQNRFIVVCSGSRGCV